MELNSEDYKRGYADGLKGAFDELELDAFYAGVGYGKKANGIKNIGFSSPEEKASFEQGINNSSKHFQAPRYEPLSFFERLLGKGESFHKIKRSRRRRARSQKHYERAQKKHSSYKEKYKNRGKK